MKFVKNNLLLFGLLMFFSSVQGQENLNLSAPDIQPNPLMSVADGGAGDFKFLVQNVNFPGYSPACGATITIMMTDIEPTEGAISVTSSFGDASVWSWSMEPGGELLGTLIGSAGFLYSEEITVAFNVTSDSVEPGSNGFTAMVSTGTCPDGNTTDNVAASTTWTDAPLSVELLSFTVQKRAKDAVLEWSTTQEVNNDYFDLQRSYDGIKFESFGKIDGAGTSAKTHQYSFVDEAAIQRAQTFRIPNIYYRIEQFDFDGSSVYTPIRSIQIEKDLDGQKASMFPNPATDFVQILTTGTDKYALNVYDELGQLIESMTVSNSQKVSTENWNPGAYIFELIDGSNQESILKERIIVVK